jgi:hypothetical protein
MHWIKTRSKWWMWLFLGAMAVPFTPGCERDSPLEEAAEEID